MTKIDVWKNNVLTERNMTSSEKTEWDSHNTAEKITEKKLNWIKNIRQEKLNETDWWVLRGTMTDAQKDFRQNLRDIPTNHVDEAAYDLLLARDVDNELTHLIWSKP